jgi:hypothetical protein
MRRLILACSATLFFVARAEAMTGAELLQSNRQFAEGYVLGAVESYLLTHEEDKEEQARQMKRLACVMRSGAKSSALYEAVAHHIRSNPTALAEYALSSVYRTIIEMCDQ